MTCTTIPTPSTPLRDRMIEDMKLHRLCRTTQRNYLRDVSRFATWLGRPPDTATDEDLRRYQIEQSEMGFGAVNGHRTFRIYGRLKFPRSGDGEQVR